MGITYTIKALSKAVFRADTGCNGSSENSVFPPVVLSSWEENIVQKMLDLSLGPKQVLLDFKKVENS